MPFLTVPRTINRPNAQPLCIRSVHAHRRFRLKDICWLMMRGRVEKTTKSPSRKTMPTFGGDITDWEFGLLGVCIEFYPILDFLTVKEFVWGLNPVFPPKYAHGAGCPRYRKNVPRSWTSWQKSNSFQWVITNPGLNECVSLFGLQALYPQ